MGDVRVGFDGGVNQVAQERFASVFTRTRRTLHDHRAIAFISRLHDGLNLLQIVDVKSGQAVAVFRRMIQQLPH